MTDVARLRARVAALGDRLGGSAGALGLFIAVTVAGFARVVIAPSRIGVPVGDTYGNVWALTWVARHLVRPTEILWANMFYPFPRSLTLTEGLFAQALEATPLLAAGASPLVAYNLVWLATFPLCALGAYLLARHLSGSRIGGLVAGLSYGFSAYRLTRLQHLQTLSFQWLPLFVLLLLLSLERPRLRRLLGLGALAVGQALSSGYYAAMLPLVTGIVLAFHLRAPGLRRVLLTLALSALVVTPILWPYARAQSQLGVARSRAECAAWSADLLSLLRPEPGTMTPLRPLLTRVVPAGRSVLYPGGAVLLLSLAGATLIRRERAARLMIVLAGVAFVLALGPDVRLGSLTLTGPYELLRGLPGFRALRTPERMYPVVGLGLVSLAALGWAALSRRYRVTIWLAPLLLVWAVVEAVPRVDGWLGEIVPAPLYTRTLAAAPRGPVLELPYEWRHANARYLYWSLDHGQWLVNGWGAFQPPEPAHLGDIGRRWPLPGAAREIGAAGVRYVVVHLDELPERLRERVLRSPLPEGVTLMYEGEGQRVYALAGESSPGGSRAVKQSGIRAGSTP
jgi:hypothetical protein